MVAEANVELLEYVSETLQAEAKKPFLDIDALQPQRVSQLVSHQLEMHSDWEEMKRQPGRVGLNAQYQWLRELRSAKPTKAFR